MARTRRRRARRNETEPTTWKTVGKYESPESRGPYHHWVSPERGLKWFRPVQATWWSKRSPGQKAAMLGTGALATAWLLGWLTAPRRAATTTTTPSTGA